MTTPLQVDHVVILVPELAAATEVWTDLGFTVVPGGAHAGSPTHNALVAFADGSYLELLSYLPGAIGPAPPPFARLLRQWPTPGLADLALSSPDVTATVVAARARGGAWDAPQASGRTRPDGLALAWTMAFPGTPDVPFLINDTTPRNERVPGGAATQHRNGVTGIGQITIAVGDLATSVPRYRALLGVEPQPWGDDHTPPVSGSTVVIPKSHPRVADLQRMSAELSTLRLVEEREALLADIRAVMAEGYAAGMTGVGTAEQHSGPGQPAEQGVDFQVGNTTISLAQPIIVISAAHNRLIRHGDGPARLTLIAPALAHPRSLAHGPDASYFATITIVPSPNP